LNRHLGAFPRQAGRPRRIDEGPDRSLRVLEHPLIIEAVPLRIGFELREKPLHLQDLAAV